VNCFDIEGLEMPSQTFLTLCAGKLRLELNPSVGGSISEFCWSDGQRLQSLLRKRNSQQENVLGASSFPLVPYVNRIRGGRFTFGGREVDLAPNMPGDPSPLHGQGWLNSWTVDDVSEDGATLGFIHRAGEWPWSYEARQEFSLDEKGLFVRLTCRNSSPHPMPCGLGQHPYFPCGRETRIDTEVESAWTIDEHVLPVEQVPTEGRFDLRNRRVCGQDLDHGFGGWAGKATLIDPEWPCDLVMSSPDARFFQLYSPPGGGIFVAEPVTHANAALNAPQSEWPELGMRVLEPGETMHLDMRIDVMAK
jgi:aldose 1-epimerase